MNGSLTSALASALTRHGRGHRFFGVGLGRAGKQPAGPAEICCSKRHVSIALRSGSRKERKLRCSVCCCHNRSQKAFASHLYHFLAWFTPKPPCDTASVHTLFDELWLLPYSLSRQRMERMQKQKTEPTALVPNIVAGNAMQYEEQNRRCQRCTL